MKKTILSLSLCLLAVMPMAAQMVDKDKVTANAEAAAKAGEDLKKLVSADKAWTFDGTVGLNAAATGLVNWSAGGKNNTSGFLYAKLHLLYSKDNLAWETNLDTDFGLTWTDQKEDAIKKSTDNIRLTTKFGWEFKETWYLTVNAGFQSQYAIGRKYQTGYDPIMSKWLAPSYTDISVGIDWKKSYKGADFSIFLSPVAGRITTAYIGDEWNRKYSYERLDALLSSGDITQTQYDAYKADFSAVVRDYVDIRSDLQRTLGTFTYAKKAMTIDGIDYKIGDPIYRNARAEFGLSFKGGIAYTYKDMKLSTTLNLFSPYQGKGFSLKEAWLQADNTRTEADWEARPAEEKYYLYSNNNRYFGHFDVDWDVALSYQFLKCLQITFSTSLKYYNGTLIADADGIEAERVQFKGVLGLGVGYSF